MFSALLRLIGLVSIGYILFRPQRMRRRVLVPLSFVVINILIPLFMITRYGSGWDIAIAQGAFWVPVFFLIGGATLCLQYILAKVLLKWTEVFSSITAQNRSDFILLFTVHNAGYIALPILETLAPEAVLVYMFSYILAIQLIFWSLAVSIIRSRENERFRLWFRPNAPFLGLMAGIVLAVTGVYQSLPPGVTYPLETASRYAMDGILVVLGGILAGVPHFRLTRHREFLPFLLVRQTMLPALILCLMVLLRQLFNGPALLPGTRIGLSDTWRWLQLVLVTQAAVPPATNIMIAVHNFGTQNQLTYAGTGIMISYLGASLSLPLFVLLAYVL